MLSKDHALCSNQSSHSENVGIIIRCMSEPDFLLFKYLV